MIAASRVLWVALGLLVGAAAPAFAQTVEEFYSGRRIDLYIGYSAGGGYDAHARTLARHIGRHIPGHPEVVPVNRPGAGSLVLANELATTLPSDGTAIAALGRGVVTEPINGNPDTRFDPRNAGWIGSTSEELAVCAVWHTVPVRTWQDLRSRGLIVGSTGAGSSSTQIADLMNNLLGTRLKQIAGYGGSAEVYLAMERGEVEGRCGDSYSSLVSQRSDLIEDGKIRIILQLAEEKSSDLPNVPGIMELTTSDLEREILSIFFLPQRIGRPYVAPAGVPADRLAALRDAFDATMRDPEYQADIKRQGLDFAPLSGAEVESRIAQVYSMPAEVFEAARQAMSASADVEVLDAPTSR